MTVAHRVFRRAAQPARRSILAGAAAAALLIPFSGESPVLAQDDPRQPSAMPQASAPSGDRVGRLEAEIADLQAMVAALQSFVKSRPDVTLPQEGASGAAPANFGGGSSALTARVDALETQIGALTSQIELVTQQLGSLQAKLNGNESPQPMAPMAPPQDAPLRTLPDEEPLQTLPGEGLDRRGEGTPGQRAHANASGGGGLFGREGRDVTGSVGAGERLAALPGNAEAVSLYNQGYNHFLSGDYEAAAKTFEEVAERFPGDPASAKATYWLGEAHYVQGQFKKAAKAFLASFKTSETGEKAPHSLLKLAMTLGELGKKDAACSTFKELEQRFPRAGLQLQGQVATERRKAGC